MADKKKCRQRQEEELEVIKSIFGNDVKDMRQNADATTTWQPLDLVITLLPQQGSSGNQELYTRTNLHILCPPKYPKLPPKISLENTKGLSDSEKNELLDQLHRLSESHKGEVMIYDLAQFVQTFLHKHNKMPTKSFYDQMLIEKTKRDEALMQQQAQKLNDEQRVLRDEVLKRKEILRNEDRWRRDARRSMSESSPTHRLSTSSEKLDGTGGMMRERVYPNECDLHSSSDVLYFSSVGRKICRGCCLGHSNKGFIAYTGIDSETGQLLYITEWTLKYSQLDTKCTINCQFEHGKCGGHRVEEIVECIEKLVSQLAQLRHRNLVAYECVLCMRKKEGVLVYLVQDFVLGTSVNSISRSLGWSYNGCSFMARGILDALLYLHNKGVSHNNLDDFSVILDNSSVCRVADFALIPYLSYLNGGTRNVQHDFPALGNLIESLLQLPNSDSYDFIEQCKSERTLSASDLLEHPFLMRVDHTLPAEAKAIVLPTTKTVDDLPMHTSMTGHSRLQKEFEVMQWLGQGAYGDVLKVRNTLDNRLYAIKRIPLTTRSRQIYNKMKREVELLSRVHHENVVRYFNSWIESASEADLKKYSANPCDDDDEDKDSYTSATDDQQLCVVSKAEQTVSDDEDDWMGISASNVHDSSSDGIQFVNSDGEVVEFDDDESDLDSETPNGRVSSTSYAKSPRHEIQIMYIQMEFCEKSTLRTAIDNNLASNRERFWRLFREITEGLAHIHSEGIIHRDLKPVNIFLCSRDQVKIGDFGLATTSFLALQHGQDVSSLSHGNRTTEIGSSHTGKVGTALYVAPELMGRASKSTYSQKVDLYSLGIIFFEMCHRPFTTGMERVETLVALRSPNIALPSYMLNNAECEQQIKVFKWLLNHDPSKRPTADELLASDLMPPQQLEDNELQEALRHVLANPQSKLYKHLVSRCLAQQSDTVMDFTYHFGLVQTNSKLEMIKKKIISLFRKHGGIELKTPLLSPYMKSTRNNAVRLMTTSGGVVVLPHDLRSPFIKHVALNGIQLMRRYTIDRVYREKKGFNFHPKQLYECAFDIITPTADGRSHLVDAELISMAFELTQIIPSFTQRNLSIRINHTSMLRAIMSHHNVPVDKYSDIFGAVLDFIDRRISKFQLHSIVTSLLETSKQSASTLIDALLTEFQLGGPKGFNTNAPSSLRSLLRGHSEASQLARSAMDDIDHVVSLAHGLGVMCTINFHAGFSIGFERAKTGGIIWQLLSDLKSERKAPPYVLGVGGRYDYMLSEIQKQATHRCLTTTVKNISGAGLSFALDKILAVLTMCHTPDPPSVDVIVCVTGNRPNMREVTQILRAFWVAGIQCAFVESNNPDEGQDMAKELGAIYYVVYSDDGTLRLRSWINDKFEERMLNRDELILHVKRLLGPESNAEPSSQLLSYSTSFSDASPMGASRANNSSRSVSSDHSLPNVNISFITIEKMTSSTRRRFENVITQHMTSSLLLFNRKQEIAVVAVDLPPQVVRAIIGAIDPNVTNEKEISNEITYAIDRYPDYKRFIKDIVEEVIDIYSEKKQSPVVCLYSLKDSYFRFIL